MNIWDVELAVRDEKSDTVGRGTLAAIRELGVRSVSAVRHSRILRIAGELTVEAIDEIARRLLADPIVERYSVDDPLIERGAPPGGRVVVVARKTG